jgi:hypothetical protein
MCLKQGVVKNSKDERKTGCIEFTKEMLKMKVDPAICLKTRVRTTKGTRIYPVFWPKMQRLCGFDDNSLELSEKTHGVRDIRGQSGLLFKGNRKLQSGKLLGSSRPDPSPIRGPLGSGSSWEHNEHRPGGGVPCLQT